MRHVTAIALLLAGAMLVGAGCQQDKKESPKAAKAAGGGPNSLWNRLGGEESVRKVVHSFVMKGAANRNVNFTRDGHSNEWQPTEKNIKQLEQRLVEFISENTGGPLRYKGRSMEVAHKDMRIRGPEFDALAQDLATTLDEFGVPEKEKNELLQIVGSTRPAIIDK